MLGVVPQKGPLKLGRVLKQSLWKDFPNYIQMIISFITFYMQACVSTRGDLNTLGIHWALFL